MPRAVGVRLAGDGIHGRDRPGGGGGGGGWEEEGLFKTNAVWRRWWKKEQEVRVMNTRREGKGCELQRNPLPFYSVCKRD